MIGKDYVVPVYAMFPVWKFGARTNIFGEPLPDGWWPDRFLSYRFKTREEAEAFINAHR